MSDLGAAPESIGDLRLGLGSARRPEGPSGRFGGAWHSIADGEDWSLRAAPRDPSWLGVPYARYDGPDWLAVRLGETYPLSTRQAEGRRIAALLEADDRSVLNGHFALVARFEANGEWHVWTSPFGSLHLFHGPTDGGAVLGTAAADVRRGGTTDVDPSALRSLLRYGFFLGDATHDRGIRILRPGSRYVLDRAGKVTSVERYWNWSETNEAVGNDPVADFDERLRLVVGDLTGDRRVALPISGGLDSRSTVAALNGAPESSPRVEAFSYGYREGSIETTIAAEVARARQLELTRFTIAPYLLDRLPQMTAQLEGFQDVTLPRQAAITGRLRSDRVLAAHWGDVWLDASAGSGQRVGPDLADRKLAKPGSSWLEERFRPDAEDPRDHLEREWRAYEAIEEPDLRLKAFKTDQWSFRWTLTSLRAYQSWAFPRLPFYDTRITRLLMAIDPERLRGRRLQVEHLRRFAPNLAEVTWEATGTDLFRHDVDRSKARRSRSVMRRALAKGRRLMTGDRPIERNWEIQFAGSQARDRIERLLGSPSELFQSWFRPDDVTELIEDFYRRWPDRELGYALSMLVTLASWSDARSD